MGAIRPERSFESLAMIKLLLLSDLVLDAGTQIRTENNLDHVADLVEAYEAKRHVPPIDTFYNGGSKYVVADGFHRVFAAQKLEATHIKSEVHPGNKDSALLFALKANVGHGLRRTNADKRNAIRIALSKWPRKNNTEIADICAVSRHMVDNFKPPKDITPADLTSPRQLSIPSEQVNTAYEKPESSPAPPPPMAAPSPDPSTAVPTGDPTGGPAPDPAPDPAPAPVPAPASVEQVGEDDMGYPLTKYTVELFNRKGEMEKHCEKLMEVRNEVRNVQRCGGDELYRHLNISSFLSNLELSIVSLKGAIPYAVCPYCQGLNLEQCTNCRHVGLVGKFMFERQIPTEFMAMRKLRIEELQAQRKAKK